jgi:hypothetical protein
MAGAVIQDVYQGVLYSRNFMAHKIIVQLLQTKLGNNNHIKRIK